MTVHGRNRLSIRGILFDKDGTLFDFSATWRRVVETLLREIAPGPAEAEAMARDAGYDPARRRFLPGSPIVAGATSEVARIWARHRPDLGAGAIEVHANAVATRMVTTRGGLAPAAADLPGLLTGLAGRGLSLGVATHDSEAGTRRQLAAAGAGEIFDFIAGYDSGHGLKPGPGMLHAFAALTGIAASEVAMVGDSAHDLQMVRNGGGALAIGVLTGPATETDLAPHADHILASIEDLPALLDTLSA